MFRLFLTFSALATLTSTFSATPTLAQAEAASKPIARGPERLLESLMEIHYLVPEIKSPYDTVVIGGQSAKLSVWRDLSAEPDPEQVECLGYRWLLTGRGQKLGLGAKEVFATFPKLQDITLELVEVDFELKGTDGRGKIEKVSKRKPFLKMTVKRNSLKSKKYENKRLKKHMLKSRSECLRIGRLLIKDKEIKL